MTHPRRLPAPGFTLVELSIVLIIVALLASGLMLGLSSQRTLRDNADARQQLDEAKEALLGFAITNGRLPCPADPTLTNNGAGQEDRPNSSSPCNRQHGVLPWTTLGIQELDPWGQRLTYFASSKFTAALPAGAQASFTLDTGVFPNNSGTANILDNSGGNTIAADLPAVIVSHGSRAAGGYQSTGNQVAGASGDEQENADADFSFISHTPSDTFDDQVAWILPSVLKSRLVAAGRLP